jgi:hypothetical protein
MEVLFNNKLMSTFASTIRAWVKIVVVVAISSNWPQSLARYDELRRAPGNERYPSLHSDHHQSHRRHDSTYAQRAGFLQYFRILKLQLFLFSYCHRLRSYYRQKQSEYMYLLIRFITRIILFLQVQASSVATARGGAERALSIQCNCACNAVR